MIMTMDNDTVTITFNRPKLYNMGGGLDLADMPIAHFLSLISETVDKPDRLDTLAALREYGITVHDHWVHSSGSHMFGPTPSADSEIK